MRETNRQEVARHRAVDEHGLAIDVIEVHDIHTCTTVGGTTWRGIASIEFERADGSPVIRNGDGAFVFGPRRMPSIRPFPDHACDESEHIVQSVYPRALFRIDASGYWIQAVRDQLSHRWPTAREAWAEAARLILSPFQAKHQTK